MSEQLFFTVSQIAAASGCAPYRVTYQIKRLQLMPAFRAGHTNLFTRAQYDRVVEELRYNDEAVERRRAVKRQAEGGVE